MSTGRGRHELGKIELDEGNQPKLVHFKCILVRSVAGNDLGTLGVLEMVVVLGKLRL